MSARCCYHMKKAPLNKFERLSGRKPIIGTMACESRLRMQKWLQAGCNAFERKMCIRDRPCFPFGMYCSLPTAIKS